MKAARELVAGLECEFIEETDQGRIVQIRHEPFHRDDVLRQPVRPALRSQGRRPGSLAVVGEVEGKTPHAPRLGIGSAGQAQEADTAPARPAPEFCLERPAEFHGLVQRVLDPAAILRMDRREQIRAALLEGRSAWARAEKQSEGMREQERVRGGVQHPWAEAARIRKRRFEITRGRLAPMRQHVPLSLPRQTGRDASRHQIYNLRLAQP